MELTMDLSQCLVARQGEVITCPECGAGLARFRRETTAADWLREWPSGHVAAATLLAMLPAGLLITIRRTGVDLRCRCGGDPTGRAAGGGALADCPGPRLHIGGHWRLLGGE